MEQAPALAAAALILTLCSGLSGGQSVDIPRQLNIRPPAPPPGEDPGLEVRAPAPPVSPGALEVRAPAPPVSPGALEVRAPAPPIDPSPPAPPPTTDRACVSRHVGNGEFKKECIDITARCAQKNCSADMVCGLNLDEEIECFSGSVRNFQNCRPDYFRLAQPCPADAGIRGFGMGCNYCVGGNPFAGGSPFAPEPEPPASSRRLTGGSPPGPYPPAPAPPRACVVSYSDAPGAVGECVDISARCERRQCPTNTICALDLGGSIQCLSEPMTLIENCDSEELRLQQPCPPDTGISGYGMGCTYCTGANPFLGGPEPPAPEPPAPGPTGGPEPPAPGPAGGPDSVQGRVPPPPLSDRACLVIYVRDGRFKSECISISERCASLNCRSEEVCGLDHDERAVCFSASVKEFQNCGTEQFRLEQPCPADSGIRGFGMGCTFCRGGNPFATRFHRGRELIGGPFRDQEACVVRFIRDGMFKRECRSIKAECDQKQCPQGTVCGLDLDENITCFDGSVREFENCGRREFRLEQPCPADAGIRGFGMGCTFCVGGNPFIPIPPEPVPPPFGPPEPTREPVDPPQPAPTQTTAAGSDQSITNRVACVSRVTASGALRRGCMDITELCQRRGCPSDRLCALDAYEQPSCFAASQLPLRNCGTTRERILQPCPTGAEVVAYAAGCTFCRPPPTAAPTPAPGAPRRACIVSGAVRRCETITARCEQLSCAETCALGLDGETRCFTAAELGTPNCGPEMRRLDQPCPAGMRAVAFAASCTYCRPQ